MRMLEKNRSVAAQFLKNRDAWIRALVEDDSLAHPTVRVGIHLAMRTDGREASKGAWPAVSTIAKATHVSVRAVINALAELEGYTDRERPGVKCGRSYVIAKRKRNTGNRYWINFFWE